MDPTVALPLVMPGRFGVVCRPSLHSDGPLDEGSHCSRYEVVEGQRPVIGGLFPQPSLLGPADDGGLPGEGPDLPGQAREVLL